MKNKKVLGIGFALLVLSRGAWAGVPDYSYSHDYDIGTLTSSGYTTSFGAATYMLLHSYTFDLAAPAIVDAAFLNPRWETGNIFTGIPPLTITIYDINIFDSQDHLLYAGTTTERWDFGSTRLLHVGGLLPAGENYYVRIAGQQINDTAMEYKMNLAATPIPEPEIWGMMMVGLGILGWRLGRRSN